jgi:aspartyl aminopeptidase
MEHVQNLIDFLNRAVSPFHAAQIITERLDAAGFVRLDEADRWSLDPGGGYYTIRDGQTVSAFRIGRLPVEDAGFLLFGAHTDSPALQPRIDAFAVEDGYARVPVSVYGGPLYATWLDRELACAGRIVLRDGDGLRGVLFDSEAPIAVIPNVAIHLNRKANEEGVTYEAHQHLTALVAAGPDAAWSTYLAERVGVPHEEILSSDLFFYDPQPARPVGIDGSLLLSGRLDNLASCWIGLGALMRTNDVEHTVFASFYSHEEIGSRTAGGAASNGTEATLSRIVGRGLQSESYSRAVARSFLLSMDAAHGFHPNYSDRSDAHYRPVLNGGLVVKRAASRSYVTDDIGTAAVLLASRRVDAPVQELRPRGDARTGGTIGPIVGAAIGVPGADVGLPLLGMHSIRETVGVHDIESSTRIVAEMMRSGPPTLKCV